MDPPFEIRQVKEEEESKMKQLFTSMRSGFIRVGDKAWFMSENYRKHAKPIFNMQVRPDDIWLVTFPKSGTTMTQELVWLLLNNLDFKSSKEVPLFNRSPFIEHSSFYDAEIIKEAIDKFPQYKETLEKVSIPRYIFAEQLSSPRLLKTHLPFSLLPQNLENRCKVIYVARNPKDVSVSYFYHHSSSSSFGFKGTYPEFLNYFINDLVIASPYWEHLRDGWERRNHPNVLFIFYEDFIKNIEETIRKISSFLGKELTNEELSSLVNHLQIENFRQNVLIRNQQESIAFKFNNPKLTENNQQFIRQGGIGKNKEITEELNAILDQWIEKNQKDLNIPFKMK